MDLWANYNEMYFASELRPILITRTRTFRYGGCVGMTTIGTNARHLQVKEFSPEVCDGQRAILLHEMVHQLLCQRGVSTKLASEEWCAEVRRISAALGAPVWAGQYTVVRVDGRSRRANKAPPPDAAYKILLRQSQIATWPASIGLSPPDLR